MEKIIERVNEAYGRLAPLRAARNRFKSFTYGKQWGDMMTLADGTRLTEEEYAGRTGRVPLTNNMINRLVKTIVGHFRASLPEADATDHNRLEELDSRMLEEFLVSGCAIQRVGADNRPAGSGVWVDNVSPADFFCSEIRDPRSIDAEMIGMFHTRSLPETIARYADGSRAKAEEIRRIFRDAERCRVAEVWTLEVAEQLRCHDPLTAGYYAVEAAREKEITALNRRRAKRGQPRVSVRYECVPSWHCRHLTPEGALLREHTARNHPFAVKFYPLLDAEVHPFVEGLIDQQKYINRLITLIDNMMSTSAKGVLLFPEDELSDQLGWDEVRNLWASYDGVIPYNPRQGSPGPRQIVTNPATGGAYELVNLEMKLFEQASGVSDTLQGRFSAGAGNSATLFDAQTRNSMAALADIFGSFNDFRRSRDALMSRAETAERQS